LNNNTGALQFGVGGGSYVINKPGAPSTSQDINLVCDSTAQPGNHSATLSCTNNDPNGSSPEEYSVSCTVGQPDPAIYASDPGPGSSIDITEGDPIPEGNTPPTAVLEVKNDAQPGDANMFLSCGPVSDVFGSAITSDSDPAMLLVAPQGTVDIEFTCDTTTASATPYEATYGCDWQSEVVPSLPDGGDSSESPQSFNGGSYTLTCEVREASSEVTPVTPNNQPQSKPVAPGGMASFFFTFQETFGEDKDGELQSCTLSDGSNFEIVDPLPNEFPVPVPGGDEITVEVKGTDPGNVDSFSDTLTCIYVDTANPNGFTVNYPMTLTVGGDAYFTVLKEFTDGNPGEVTVDLDCDTGLILDQEKTITEDGIGVTFIVSSFDAGKLNCNVTERDVAGYSADYDSSGDSDTTDSDDGKDGCYYTEVDGGDDNVCVVTNSPDDVNVVITKEWLYPGSADASAISDYFRFEMICQNAWIDNGSKCFPGLEKPVGGGGDSYSCKTLSGYGDKVFNVAVNPHTYPGGSCYVTEVDVDQSVEVDNGCIGSGQGIWKLQVSAGSGDACTITNTVFFEGIPTLSQYGMALLALLMLGMGFVAVRRIT
jgi:hypothetical protein